MLENYFDTMISFLCRNVNRMDGIAEQKQKEVARERSIIAERIARLSSQLDNLSL